MEIVQKNLNGNVIVLLAFIIAGITFIADIFLPLGFNISLLYLSGVIFFLLAPSNKYFIIYCILITLMLIVDIFLSPTGGNLVGGLFNKLFTTTALWGSFFLYKWNLKQVYLQNKHKQQLDALYAAATEAIIVTNSKGEIVMANPRSHKLFGYDQLIGMHIDSLLPEKYRHSHVKDRKGFMEKPAARAMGKGRDLYARKIDGSVIPVEISLSYFKQENELFVISFIIDITTRKAAEQELLDAKIAVEKYAEALKNSNQELEQFAYVASHDLQEPLRKIMAFGDRLLKKEKDRLQEDSKDYLNRIINASERMKTLINELLAFSRITSKTKLFENVNLNEILADVLNDLEIAIEKSQAEIHFSELPVINADAMQMRRLFQNLLSNALKFTQKDIKPIIDINSHLIEDNKIQIHIKDNGIGFDEKYLDRIFTIFQRLEGQNFEGSGMGLAICKKIVQKHNGDITAKSTLNEGAEFIITLPIIQSKIN